VRSAIEMDKIQYSLEATPSMISQQLKLHFVTDLNRTSHKLVLTYNWSCADESNIWRKTQETGSGTLKFFRVSLQTYKYGYLSVTRNPAHTRIYQAARLRSFLTDRTAADEQFNLVRMEEHPQRAFIRHHLKASLESSKLLFHRLIQKKVRIQINKLLEKMETKRMHSQYTLGQLLRGSSEGCMIA